MGFNIKALCDLGYASDTIDSDNIETGFVEVSDPEGTSDGEIDCENAL